MMTDKPHKGRIERWWRYPCQGGLGYGINGQFLDHEHIRGDGHTSYVVFHDEATGEIETRNSRYTLVGKESR
jgi:hypothetical protein